MIDVLYYMYYLFYLKKLKDEEPHARTIWFLGIFFSYWVFCAIDLFLLFFFEKPVYACGISDGSAGVRWIVFDQKPMRMDALT